MQANLFSPAVDFKEEALGLLSRFELLPALACLSKAKHIDPYLGDLDLLIGLSQFAHAAGAHARMSAAQSEQLWQHAEQGYGAGKISSVAIKFLRELIAQRLLAGEFAAAGFCSKTKEYLHRGVCHLVLRDWQSAHRELLNLVTEHREKALPRHWAYFADAAQILRRWAEANLGYTLALIADPHAVDELTLAHADLRGVLQRLRIKNMGESLARAWWPFAAWREKALQIHPGRTFLLSNLQQQRSLLGSTLMLEREQRLRQFCLCMYIDQANLHDQINFDARIEMQRLEPNLFVEYLDEISRRRS